MTGRGEELNTRITATDEASAVVDRVADAFDELENSETVIDVDVDAAGAQESISAIDARLGDLTDDERLVLLSIQAKGAEREIDRITKKLADADKLADDEIEIFVEAKGNAERRLDAIQAEIRDIDGSSPKITPEVDTSGVNDLRTALQNIDVPIGGANSALGSLGNGRAGIIGGIVAGLGLAANNAANFAIEVDNIAQLTGATSEEASRLLNVFTRVGVEGRDLQDIILQTNDVLASDAELAAQIGINVNDGRDAATRFVDVVERLGTQFEDATERGLAGARLFGEEGVRQVNAVTAQVGSLREAMEEVPGSLVISEDDIERARQFKEEIAEVEQGVRGLSGTVGFAAAQVANLGLNFANQAFDNTATQFERAGRGLRDLFDETSRANRELVAIYEAQELAAAQFDRALLAGAESTEDVRRIVRDYGLEVEAQNIIVVEWARSQGLFAEAAEDTARRVSDSATTIASSVNGAFGAAFAEVGRLRSIFPSFADEGEQAWLRFIQNARDGASAVEEVGGRFDAILGTLQEEDAVISLADQFQRVLEARQASEQAAVDEATNAAEARLKERKELNRLVREVVDYADTVEDIPDEKITALVTQIRAGDIAEVERLLEDLTADQEIKVRFDVQQPSEPIEVQVGTDGLDRVVLDAGNVAAANAQVTAPTQVTNYYQIAVTPTELERVASDQLFANGPRLQ